MQLYLFSRTIEVGRVSLSLLFDHGVCKYTDILVNKYKYQGKIFFLNLIIRYFIHFKVKIAQAFESTTNFV